MEVDGVSNRRFNGDIESRKVGLATGEIVVEIQDQGAKPTTAAKIVEGLNVVRVQVEVALRPVSCHLERGGGGYSPNRHFFQT